MENPVFFISEGPDLDMASSALPMWAMPTWFTSKEKAQAHWERVQECANQTGRGLYPNEGIRIVPMAEAIEARTQWLEALRD